MYDLVETYTTNSEAKTNASETARSDTDTQFTTVASIRVHVLICN